MNGHFSEDEIQMDYRHEKMCKFYRYQETANKNHSESPPNASENDHDAKNMPNPMLVRV